MNLQFYQSIVFGTLHFVIVVAGIIAIKKCYKKLRNSPDECDIILCVVGGATAVIFALFSWERAFALIRNIIVILLD